MLLQEFQLKVLKSKIFLTQQIFLTSQRPTTKLPECQSTQIARREVKY